MFRIGVFFFLFLFSSTSLFASYLPTEKDLYEVDFDNHSNEDICLTNPPIKIQIEDRSKWNKQVFMDFLIKSAESMSGREIVSTLHFHDKNQIWFLDDYEVNFEFNANGDILEYRFDPEDTVSGGPQRFKSCI